MFACLNRSPFGRSSPAVHTQQSLARPKRANRMPSLTASLNDMIRTCWISNTRKKHWLISINTDWVKRRRSLGNTVRMFTFVIGGITTNKLAFFLFFLFFLRPFHRLSEIQKKKKNPTKKGLCTNHLRKQTHMFRPDSMALFHTLGRDAHHLNRNMKFNINQRHIKSRRPMLVALPACDNVAFSASNR